MHHLDDLAVFVAVVENASLTASARDMALSKSTLSRRLGRLETQVGQPLLERRSNRLVPTEAGETFAGYCRHMLDLSRESRHALDNLRERVSGQLTVHAHPLFMRGWFTHRVEAFLERFPEMELTLATLTQPPTAESDIAICLWPGALEDCGLRTETVGRLTRGIYAHPDYLAERGTPLHPRDLAAHDWVDMLGALRDGLTLRRADGSAHRLAPLRSRSRADQDVLQADAIVRGRGLGVLPDWMVARRLRAHPGTLVSCLQDWTLPAVPITLACPHGRLPRKTLCLLDHLRAAIPPDWRRAGDAPPRPT
ncbi:LysR family transcriptional regulator [Salinisphaera orenii MK-B5]|uniref:LysR family transcriptional regulator n=1 Tax=Salinisphaera orenii MK-B5 TaxID=856730 RepID=A0A423PSC5_9GAMM|nr:LysR family transcriptional regulator [Salinisphaera orenii]ROO28484.1 LysR family transcriptional regulator [Salinisphaera orenii MK-B5]